jgi:hypothetical protein
MECAGLKKDNQIQALIYLRPRNPNREKFNLSHNATQKGVERLVNSELIKVG